MKCTSNVPKIRTLPLIEIDEKKLIILAPETGVAPLIKILYNYAWSQIQRITISFLQDQHDRAV